jgi:RNA polymerase sigma factor (TIGR02999 family)
LKQLAHYYLRHERPQRTTQTTALVHELYLRMFGHEATAWQDRDHFFRTAGAMMRHILIDHARRRRVRACAHERHQLLLDKVIERADKTDLIALDEALENLKAIAPRASQVVDLRFFLGLTEQETAEALNTSLVTVKRDWRFARSFLFNQLKDSDKLPSA